MAENNDEQLDLQIPEKNDMMLFAEDLVELSLSQSNDFEWVPTEFCDRSYNTSVPIIRRAIDFIRYYLADEHENLFSKMEIINLFNSNSFERSDIILAAKRLPGSLEANFLLYCANLSDMAEKLYIQDIRDAPDLAKRYIYRFLQEHVSAKVWDDICRISEAIVKMLRDSLNELDISSVSDDIEHQEQEQDEVSSESSSSPGEEAIDSRLRGSNTAFKAACKEIKGYLKLYAHAYLKSGCKIGLCSLREQESPSGDKPPTVLFERNKGINGLKSDDKPRPGASYIVYELFYIISEFKIKTNQLWNNIKLIDKSNSD